MSIKYLDIDKFFYVCTFWTIAWMESHVVAAVCTVAMASAVRKQPQGHGYIDKPNKLIYIYIYTSKKYKIRIYIYKYIYIYIKIYIYICIYT